MGFNMGSIVIPTLPIDQRYVAKNVEIKNNIIYNIHGWSTIGANGWHNADIHHNTIYNSMKNAIEINEASFASNDPYAVAYCEQNPSRCSTCSASSDCVVIDYKSKYVSIKNNIFYDTEDEGLRIWADEGLEISNNIFYDPDGPVSLKYKSNSYSFGDFPSQYLSGSYEVDPDLADVSNDDFSLLSDSLAVDKGLDLDVTVDILGNIRDSSPDIGAYEYVDEEIPLFEPPQEPPVDPPVELPVVCTDINDVVALVNRWLSNEEGVTISNVVEIIKEWKSCQ